MELGKILIFSINNGGWERAGKGGGGGEVEEGGERWKE